jgi:putative transposase
MSRKSRKPALDAPPGRVAFGASGVWASPADGLLAAGRLAREREAHWPADAGDGSGLEAIYCKPGTSTPQPGHEIYPYLLRHKAITGPDQVWCADITYIPMKHGFMYLMAVMDWWSRFVLAWELSNTLDAAFCVQAWQVALARGTQLPLIANTDQGAQFTSAEYVGAVQEAGVLVSMDGRGRWMDNRFVERLWRSLKYEDIYLRGYEHGLELRQGVGNWFGDYNDYRPHQALGYATPAEVYRAPESHGAKPASWT